MTVVHGFGGSNDTSDCGTKRAKASWDGSRAKAIIRLSIKSPYPVFMARLADALNRRLIPIFAKNALKAAAAKKCTGE
jgi:hypothetical protein